MRILILIINAALYISINSAQAQERDIDFGKLSPNEIYSAIKTALHDTAVKENEFHSKSKTPDKKTGLAGNYDTSKEGKYYDISECHNSVPFDYNVKQFSSQDAAIVSANYAMKLENNLKKFGIPEAVWKKNIDNINQIGINSLESSGSWRIEDKGDYGVSFFAAKKKIEKNTNELLKSLQQYRAQNKGKPLFKAKPECGAGEESTDIIGNSALVTFSYIPFFNFRICQLIGVTPENQEKCTGWKSQRFSGTKASIPEVLGLYQYVAKLPGGVTKRGEFYGKGYSGNANDTIRIDLR